MVAAVSRPRALVGLGLALLSLAALAPSARALPRTNPADRLLAVPVDTLRYDHARGCRKTMTKGAMALVAWLRRNTSGEYWGGLRCERLGAASFSMHAEGRAVDWHLDAGDARDRREAERLLALLFGPDSAGNPSALARRMGIIEAIWDCRYHGFWMDGASKRYGACRGGSSRKRVDPTTAHRDHVHFSLGWPGARMRTSYWRYAWLRQPLPDLSGAPFGDAPADQAPPATAPKVKRPAVAPPGAQSVPPEQSAPGDDEGGYDEPVDADSVDA